MGALHFDITADDADFRRKVEAAQSLVRDASRQIEKSGLGIEEFFRRATAAAAAFGGAFTVKELVQKVVQVRGEFQQLEVAFSTLLQSKDKADALMAQMVRTAATTPFSLKDVTQGAKQLLAYGTAAEDVNSTLIRLGDIAAGLSIPLGDLVYLYGTTMTQGRMYTIDLRQFMGRGIPIAEELAKQFGVTKDEVAGLVSAGKVGAAEFQKAIESLTDEGSKFGGLMEAQSKTIAGQISNIGDSIEMMFNSIGKSGEGIINTALSGVSYAVENYEAIGKAIAEAAAVYGTYKAVLMAVTAMQQLQNTVLRQAVVEKNLAAVAGVTLSNAEAVAAARTKLLSVAQTGLVKALKSVKAAMLTNPYTLVAAAVAGLAYGIYKLATYETEAEKAQKRLNKAISEADAAALSEQRELSRLKGELSALTKGSDEYNAVKERIVKQFGKYYDGLGDEIDKVGLTEEAYNKLTEAITKSYGARQYAKFAQGEQENLDSVMTRNLEKIQERLYKELGDETGAEVYTKVRQAVIEQRELESDLQATLDSVQNKGTIAADSKIDGWLRNIREAQRVADEIDRKARVRFGVDDNATATDTNTEGSTATVTAPKAQNRKYWEERKKEAEEARNALDVQKRNSGEWNALTRQIQEAQEQIDKYSMSGKAAKGGGTSVADERIAAEEKLSDMLLSLEKDNRKEEIDLMEDGTEKRLAQIRADYEARKEEMERQAAELAELNAKAGATDLNGNGLTSVQQGAVDSANSLNERDRQQEEVRVQKEALEQMLSQVQTYEQRRAEVEAEYAERRKALYEEDGTTLREGVTQGNVEELDYQENEALSAVDEQFASREAEYQAWMDEVASLTLEKLYDALEQAQAALDEAKANGTGGSKLAMAQAKVNTAKSRIQQAQAKAKARTDDGSPDDKTYKKWKDLYDVLNDCSDAFRDVGDAVGGTAGEVISTVGTITASALSGVNSIKTTVDAAMEGEKATAKGATAAMSTVEKASVILTIIQVALQVVTAIFSLFKNTRKDAVEAVKNEFAELNDDLTELKRNAAVDAFEGTIFGKDAFTNFKSNMSVAKDALKGYNDTADEIIHRRDVVNRKDIGSTYVNFANRSLEDAVGDMKVIMYQKRNGKGKIKETSTLRERLPDLYNEDGTLNLEALKKFQESDTFDRISDENQEAITNLINNWEQYEAAIKSSKEYLDGIFGDMGDSLTDAFVDAFENGTDAMESFSDSVGEMLEELVKSMIQSMFFEELFEKYEDKLMNIFKDPNLSDEERMKKWTTTLGNLATEAMGQQENVNKYLQAAKDAGAENGIDMFTGEGYEQEATSGGFEAMGQDTAEELNGRFTALQITGEDIKAQLVQGLLSMQAVSSGITAGNAMLGSMLEQDMIRNGYLEDIVRYSKTMAKYGEMYFEKIVTNTNALTTRG